MKAVVLGGAGFIGSALAKRLENERYTVSVLDDFSSGYKENLEGFKGKIIPKSILEQESLTAALENANLIYHLAALNCLPDCSADVTRAMEVNVKGTAQVLETARKVAAKNAHVVFTSSSAVYEGSNKLPCNEEDELNPFLAYSISKLIGEQVCKSFYKSFGLPYTAMRPFNVYGENQDFRRTAPPVVMALALPLLKGERAKIYGDGKQSRDFIHVDDLVELFVLASKNQSAVGEAFNGGTGTALSVLDIYSQICKELKIERKPVFSSPKNLYEKYGSLEEGRFKFDKNIVSHEALRCTRADMSKAKKLLNWEPKISIEEGIHRSVEYLKHNL